MGARKTAIRALIAVEQDGGYSNLVLDNALKQASLSGEDAALVTALFYGVLERKRTLDYQLQPFLTRAGKLSPTVRNALRIGLYSLLYMDRIPPFAAISESVEAVKHSRDARAAGLVNAVLRNVQRQGVRALPDGDDAVSLGVTYSCEDWLAARLLADFGAAQTKQLLASFLEKPATFLRVNTVKTDAHALRDLLAQEGAETEPIDQMPNTLRLQRGSVEATTAYRDGLFHVQDVSSQCCCEALDAKPTMRVLDLCAAPGGKTFTVAECMQNRGEIVSRDLHASRAKLIADGAARLGLTCVHASQGDATQFDTALGTFDRVLCDVPCSGIGVLRRKPEIKYKPDFDAEALSQIQATILQNGARYVKSGGVLVYSTCTLFSRENDAVVDAFLQRNPDFTRLGVSVLRLPQDGSDGFFYARLQRK